MFVLETECIGTKRCVDRSIIATIAQMLHIDHRYIQNPSGNIDLLIGLENANLLLFQIHTVHGKQVHNTFFTKDIILATSQASKGLVLKGSIGGQNFGDQNDVFNSQQHPRVSEIRGRVMAQTFTFFQPATQSDLNLIPKKERTFVYNSFV